MESLGWIFGLLAIAMVVGTQAEVSKLKKKIEKLEADIKNTHDDS